MQTSSDELWLQLLHRGHGRRIGREVLYGQPAAKHKCTHRAQATATPTRGYSSSCKTSPSLNHQCKVVLPPYFTQRGHMRDSPDRPPSRTVRALRSRITTHFLGANTRRTAETIETTTVGDA